MKTIVLLALQESMAQRSAGKQDQWPGYMTILVVNHGLAKSISILTMVVPPMIQFQIDTLHDSSSQEEKWTLALC